MIHIPRIRGYTIRQDNHLVLHFMRLRFITFLALFPLSSAALANDTEFNMPAPSPWEEEVSLAKMDIAPRHISIKDLEKIIEPSVGKNNKDVSKIEALYSTRIVESLEQYGYDLFQNNNKDKSSVDKLSIPTGAVQESFILSVGDQLNVTLRGQVNNRQNYEVDNQGLLIIEDLHPITAAGRSLKEVKADLAAQISTLHNTEIYVSLATIRQIGVLIVGHVHQPGRQTLTAFNTVLDALTQAGGIQKTGSLRQIKLVRNGKSTTIDLYQLLLASNSGTDKLLQDGDRIIIPPVGQTMAVSGAVKRPAIYELRNGERISTHQAINLAGGILTPGQNRYMKLEYTNKGEEVIDDVTALEQQAFGDGSILVVAQSEQKRSEDVTLSGNTRQPGTHALQKAGSLSALINNEKILGNDIYPLIGVIERHDKDDLTQKLIAFSPYQVIKKKFDQKLSEGDEVRLFSMEQIRALELDTPLLHKASIDNKKSEIISDPVLAAFLKERSIFVRGAVRQAGAYPVTEGTTLKNILSVSGGIALEDNEENIELASRDNGRRTINMGIEDPAAITIQAGDTIRVNQKFDKIAPKTVSIGGEVNSPGQYDLMAGDSLLDLINRAGGMTAQAYPDGTIFSREEKRKREKSRYKAQAQDLELKLAASLEQTDDNKKPDMTQISATQSLISQLKEADAVGRITVEADPAALTANPAENILLEKGDRIYIPKRPLTVRVAGEVLSPAALQFREGKDPMDYLSEAGGTTHYADKDRTFVIFPDGSAQPLNVSSWNHSSALIPPGSTIIVPRDPKPFDFIESAARVSQMIANLAISGLYVEAIGDND